MKSVAERAEFVAVKKGRVVVCENEPGDAFYVVASGRLEAFANAAGGGEHIFAHYSNGDYFGETPLLSEETQWASVRALSDCTLLKISRADFQEVVNRDPRVAVSFTRRMGHRIKQLTHDGRHAKGSTIIALFSALPEAGKTLLAENLYASLAHETGEPVLLLDFAGRPDPVRPGEVASLFGRLSHNYAYVLVDLPVGPTEVVIESLLQADQVLLIAKDDDAHLDATRVLLAELRARSGVEAKARIVVTAAGDLNAARVAEIERRLGRAADYRLRWIPEHEVQGAEPFVLRHPMEAYSLVVRRLARELGHQLVGLALGAGAARGLAHIGVIRVLERAGIAVDMVAGSSMGALVAAAWAVGKSADEMEQIALQIRSKRAFLKLLDPVFPGSGFIRGLRVQKFLQQIVGELTFADTLIPVKIVASDLNTLQGVVFESGKLIDAIRASISIPGVFRPVSNNGHALIDGGITDPVPVNVLARAGVSKIIAVDTIPNAVELKERELFRGRHEKHAMREVGPVLETPTGIINIYMRSMHVMQAQIATQACDHADIVLRPITTEGAWYDFYHPERYIRRGEEVTEAALEELQKLVNA